SVEYDVERRAIGGSGACPAASILWRLKQGEVAISDRFEHPISDPALRAPLLRCVAAYRAGVETERLRDDHPDLFRKARGILVGGVAPSSRAEKLGIVPGDILLVYDGRRLEWPLDLVAAVQNNR